MPLQSEPQPQSYAYENNSRDLLTEAIRAREVAENENASLRLQADQLRLKLKASDAKARKYTVTLFESRRQHKQLQEKQGEIENLKKEAVDLKAEAGKSKALAQQNSNLVTRKCALESAVTSKDREIEKLKE